MSCEAAESSGSELEGGGHHKGLGWSQRLVESRSSSGSSQGSNCTVDGSESICIAILQNKFPTKT